MCIMIILQNLIYLFFIKLITDNGLHKCDFANFTKHNICDSLILCGDNGENQNFNIIVNNDRKLTTQIGQKWNNFSQINEFLPE